jgi:DNA-binding MarR family transcriptional regulator
MRSPDQSKAVNRNSKQSPKAASPEGGSGMSLPLPTLLSQTLVAFIIEFDNEFERQMVHTTTRYRSKSGPWLTSMAMYFTCMKFVGDEGVMVGDLERLARTSTNLHGMQRWGYVVVEPAGTAGSAHSRRSVVGRPRRDWIIRPTIKGRVAREVWRPLFDAIEERWRARFGEAAIARLREALRALLRELDLSLPECLPILGYGLFSREPVLDKGRRAEKGAGWDSDAALPTLLSRALLALAIEFEAESAVSLAISANVLRVLDERGVRMRDLPRLSGVPKEAISMTMGILGKRGLAVVEADPMKTRAKIVRLTASGLMAQKAYLDRVAAIEEGWRERFGNKISELREALEVLVGKPGAEVSPLFRGLEPHPEGWRASVPRPEVLPYYPMVLHRGGHPDGS